MPSGSIPKSNPLVGRLCQWRSCEKYRHPGWPLRSTRRLTARPITHFVAEDRILGVVEAKKLTVGPDGVLPQAERYSKGIEQTPRFQGEFGVPFLYSTNGERIMFHDVRSPLNRSREVRGFRTADALKEALGRTLSRNSQSWARSR